ncbi:hypothetical protein EVAR_74231_1 [Eumeta japonica]|uniref:Uncharacterized protein n=1 Tax=Eumeta variegata TaxID=151549 RepID=A0A4C1SFF5_EUMVA|nr:hypothetical protein EVAR_74231_1 [Eumeta japonica]
MEKWKEPNPPNISSIEEVSGNLGNLLKLLCKVQILKRYRSAWTAALTGTGAGVEAKVDCGYYSERVVFKNTHLPMKTFLVVACMDVVEKFETASRLNKNTLRKAWVDEAATSGRFDRRARSRSALTTRPGEAVCKNQLLRSVHQATSSLSLEGSGLEIEKKRLTQPNATPEPSRRVIRCRSRGGRAMCRSDSSFDACVLGRGCFRIYLCRIAKGEPLAECHHCDG